MESILSNVTPTNDLVVVKDSVLNFKKPSTDVRFLSNKFVNIPPIEPISTTGTTYNFEIGTSVLPRYTYLNEIFVALKVSLVKMEEEKTAWEPVVQADNVAVSSYFLDSFFSQIDIFLNDVKVTSSNSFRDISSVMAKKLFFNQAANETFLSTEIAVPDTGNDYDSTIQIANTGFSERMLKFVGESGKPAPVITVLGEKTITLSPVCIIVIICSPF